MSPSSGTRAPACRRRFFGGAFGLCTAALVFGTGCTPRLNWRVVRHPEGLWTASFPAKPVSFSRTLSLPLRKGAAAIRLTLWAAVIDEQRFTLGIAQPMPEAARAEADARPTGPDPLLADLARGLKEAMLRNIASESTPGEAMDTLPAERLSAIGSLRLVPDAPPVSARLEMRTWVRAPYVFEAKVVGPVEGFDLDAADQFLSSVVTLPA